MKALYKGADCGDIHKGMIFEIEIDEPKKKVIVQGLTIQYTFTYKTIEKLKEAWNYGKRTN